MPDLPSGTMTFLFTDIEGSTRLWERDRPAAAAAVERHLALLGEAVAAHGGVLYKTVGDAIQAAFVTAPAAVAAALDAQRALLAEPWGDAVGALRVRIALHAGEAAPHGADYLAPALNRLARLLGAGHGGQVLLTQAVQQLSRGALPPDVTLRDLGEHRLRDLLEPERVYQLAHPALPASFPPLKTLDARPHTLPVQATPLVGREREVTAAAAALRRDDVRLLTLTGPGGTGKTRLGLQVAAELLDDYADGVFFVELAPISDPALVPAAVAVAVGVREDGGRPVSDAVLDELAPKRLLLVLDNFEQVTAGSSLVAAILARCAHVKALVTSRVPLRLRAEHEFPVSPLSLPDLERLPPPEQLVRSEAVRLFTLRACAAKPDFAVTDANALAVAEICHRLDGLPLAIELAAARIKVFPPSALLDRLGQRLKVLTGGARDLPARQQTLRGAIAWSYNLLPPDEQALFRQLAVFAGGATFEAVEAVVDSAGVVDIFEGLPSLVDKSLLRPDEEAALSRPGAPRPEPRYGMLETVREFGLEQLNASGEEEAIRDAHAAFFLALAEAAEAEPIRLAQAARWERLDAEHANLRAAFGWLRGQGNVEPALRLAGALVDWFTRHRLTEGRSWLEGLLSSPGAAAGTAARAKVLNGACLLADAQGDYERAGVLGEEALAIWQRLDDRRGTAAARRNLASVAINRQDYDRAEALCMASLASARAAGDAPGAAAAGDMLGIVAYVRGDHAGSVGHFEEVLALRREIADDAGISATLGDLAHVALVRGDYTQALELYREVLALKRTLGETWGASWCLAGFAGLAIAYGQPDRGARLFGAAAALREATGVVLRPVVRADYDRMEGVGRAALGDGAFEAAWQAGRGLVLEQAIAEAAAVSPTPV